MLGVGESIGNTGNKGCRLSTNQIRDRIEQLQANASLYGRNLTFTWSPTTPTQAQDPALLPFGGERTQEFIQWHQRVVANNWDSNKINIYFVGNVQTNVNDEERTIGLASDPLAAQGLNSQRAAIVINDGGFGASSGFRPNHSPSQVLSYNVTEHEMTHYLARFRNRTINGTFYNIGEHAPANSNNILWDVRPPPANPLVVPGGASQAGTEKFEIWDRIIQGNWNNQ